MTPELSRSLREFQDYVDDAQRAGFQTFEDALARLLNVLNPCRKRAVSQAEDR